MKIKFRVYGKAVSENAAYKKPAHGYRMYLSKEGKEWKELVAWTAKASLSKGLSPSDMKKNVHLDMTFVFPDNRKRDAHNYEKLLIDGLQGILFDDDTQVKSHYTEMGSKGEPSVTVELTTKDHDDTSKRSRV